MRAWLPDARLRPPGVLGTAQVWCVLPLLHFYFCTTSRAQHTVSLGDPSVVLCICFMPLSCADRHMDASATCALKVRAASSPSGWGFCLESLNDWFCVFGMISLS